tara:strand:- start:361 stop:657 length:297 start_codon:yes stop_codon:yes gene_type:complete
MNMSNENKDYIKADEFLERVNSVESVLLKRWDYVSRCEIEEGFFYCCDEEDHKGYRPDTRIRVCDGCGDELPLIFKNNTLFHCTECEFQYTKTGEMII